MRKYYVYALLDTSKPGKFSYGKFVFDFEPFYIGKGCGNRLKEHLRKNERYNSFKKNKISKLRKSGFEPGRIKIITNLSESSAFIFEAILIRVIGRRDLKKGPLTNLTDGGDGGKNPGKSTRLKISDNSTRMHANRTKDEKERIQKKSGESIRRTLGEKSKEEKDEQVRKRLEAMNKRSKKEKREMSEKISKSQKERFSKMDDVTKERIYSERSKRYFDLPEEERSKKIDKRIKASWHDKTEKEKKQITKKRIQRCWHDKTPEEKQAIIEKANASRARNRASKSPEELAKLYEKMVETKRLKKNNPQPR